MSKSTKLTKVTSAPEAESCMQTISKETPTKNKKPKKRSKKASDKEEFQLDVKVQPTNVIHCDHIAKKSKRKERFNDQSNRKNRVEGASSPNIHSIPSKDVGSPEFFKVSTKLYLALAPCYVEDLASGLNEFLNSYLMRYLDSVRGIVLSHNETKLLQDKGVILNDSPFINFWISTKLLVWRPTIGSRLNGTVQLQSVDHISLLLHGTFNAVLLASDIPSSIYEWAESTDEIEGEWINSATKQPLANSGVVEFYVKSLSTSQDALTVNGTLSPIQA